MSDLIVPVDVSKIKDIIPENEEVLLSAFCRVERVLKASRAIFDSHIVITPKTMFYTEPDSLGRVYGPSMKGYPTATSLENIKEFFESSKYSPKTLPLYQIKKLGFMGPMLGADTYISKDDPKYGKTKMKARYKLVRSTFFHFRRIDGVETKEEFKKRRYNFPLTFIPYVIESKKKLLETMQQFPKNYGNVDKKRCPKEIRKLEGNLEKVKAKIQKKGVEF